MKLFLYGLQKQFTNFDELWRFRKWTVLCTSRRFDQMLWSSSRDVFYLFRPLNLKCTLFIFVCCWHYFKKSKQSTKLFGFYKEYCHLKKVALKALYTFGNCQRSVFSLGLSHHKHPNKIPSQWTFGLNWSSKLREKWWKKKTPFSDEFVCFRIGIKDF